MVHTIRKKKKVMEEEIKLATIRAVEKFRRETGLSPSNVSIRLQYYSAFGTEPYYIVVDCSTTVEI